MVVVGRLTSQSRTGDAEALHPCIMARGREDVSDFTGLFSTHNVDARRPYGFGQRYRDPEAPMVHETEARLSAAMECVR